MAQFECHITIARPVSEVFALLLDLANTRYFDPGVKSVQQTTPGAIGVGTSFRFRERIPPFGRYGPASATYTAIEPNRQIVSTSRWDRRGVPEASCSASSTPGRA